MINISFKPFNYVGNAISEISLNDLYFSSIGNNAVDTNIVIVNIEDIGRDGIAALLREIYFAQPAIIGIDVLFSSEFESPYDSLLKKTLDDIKDKLVISVSYNSENVQQKGFWVFDSTYNTGHAGVMTNENNNTTVREFKPYIESEKSHFWAFSAEVAKRHTESAFNKLEERDNRREIINYIGNIHSFRVFSHSDILDTSGVILELLKNKIVLVGFCGGKVQGTFDLDDIYFTPVGFNGSINRRPDMYGIVLHANIISMILKGNYITHAPSWLIILITLVITYIHVVIFSFFYVRRHIYYHTFAKVFQLVSFTLIIFLVFIVFSRLHFYFPTKYLILPVIFSVDVLYLYEALALLCFKIFRTDSLFVKHL